MQEVTLSDISTYDQAALAASNPTTPPADLAQIAYSYPALRPLVAAHPNAYAGLLDWLRDHGDAAVTQALDQRAGSESTAVMPAAPAFSPDVPFVSGLAPQIIAPPAPVQAAARVSSGIPARIIGVSALVTAVALGLLAAFGVPGTDWHGLLAGGAPTSSAPPTSGLATIPSAPTSQPPGSTTVGPVRVPSMPSDMPSCPNGWTPIAWGTWPGGHTLVCSNQTNAYYVDVTIGSQSLTTVDATATPTGGYIAHFSGASATISLGAGLTQVTEGTVTSFVATNAWNRGVAGGFTMTPTAPLPACPGGTYPLSLSVWTGEWLLTCGTSPNLVTSFFLDDPTFGGGAMATSGDMLCGQDIKGNTVCFNSSVVMYTDYSGTAMFPTTSAYVTGQGQTNSFAPAPTPNPDPQTQALTNIATEVAQDTPIAESYLVSRWTPQLSAKWDGIVLPDKTWTSPDIWAQFQGFKARHSTALLLHSADWSSLGLTTHNWYTMVAGIGFTDPKYANLWCYDQGFDPTNCFAVQLGHGAAHGTVQMWKPSDFGG